MLNQSTVPLLLLCEQRPGNVSCLEAFGLPNIALKTATLDSLRLTITDKIMGKRSGPEGENIESRSVVLSSINEEKERLLTRRENTVLSYLYQAVMNKEIEYSMGIQECTAKTYVSSILRKFNLKSRTQLVIYQRSQTSSATFVSHRAQL